MSLTYKPHTVSVRLLTKGMSGGVATSGTYGTAASVRGQLCPASDFRGVYEQFGVDVVDPMVFLCDLADASNFAIEAKVTYGGLDYEVMADPMRWDAIGAISCAAILMERLK